MFVGAWLSAELKWARPDLGEQIRRPWLPYSYHSILLTLSRQILEEDKDGRYTRIRRLAMVLSVARIAQWVLPGLALLLLAYDHG